MYQDEDVLLALEFVSRSHDDEHFIKLREFVDKHATMPYGHKLLGDVLFHKGKLIEAESHYRVAMDLDKNNVFFAFDLGNVLYYQSRMLEALNCLLKVIKMDPEFSAAHYRIGLAYHHLGQYEKAAAHFRKCATLTPDYEMVHYHLGVVYARMGKNDEAIREFSHHLDADLRDAATRAHLDALFQKRAKELCSEVTLEKV